MGSGWRKIKKIDKERVQHVIGFIEANLHNKLNSTMIAEEAGYSRATIDRHFYTTHKISISAFIALSRLKKAHAILEQNSHTISEVAFMTGYSSCSAFTHAFKRHFGYTPMQLVERLP